MVVAAVKSPRAAFRPGGDGWVRPQADVPVTPAETRLALALFEGLTLQEAAAIFSVSPHTVHAQLASIFEKTGTNRQSQLVRLMMRAVGAIWLSPPDARRA
jgi:DNA-binding CsgD family transcriptional regulator